MNSREKLLAGMVGGLVLMIAAYFVWSAASEATSTRNARVASLNQEIARQDRTLTLASRATKQLALLKQRSLPSNREVANAVYSEFLLDLVDRVGFRDPSVRSVERRFRKASFDRLRFDIDAEATLDQLTEFLAEFYTVGDLHRIDTMSIKPLRDSRHLDVALSVEAISLPTAERETVGDVPSTDVTSETIGAARHAILNRALFFPLNIAPQLEEIPDQQLVRGRRWRLEAKASDADPWDKVTFEVTTETPEGLEFEPDGKTAKLAWTPREVGEHTIALAIRDSGSPIREAVREFKLTVVDPPEDSDTPNFDRSRVIGFDHASQTYLVATVASGERRQAWFDVRTQGKVLKVDVGSRVRIGSVEGQLSEIGRRHVQIKTGTGSLRIAIGENLAPS